MFLKVIAIIAIIGLVQAVEHAYSSQSITRFDRNQGHDEHQHEDYKYEELNHEDESALQYDHEEYKHDYNLYDDRKQHTEHKTEHKVAHPTEHYAIVQHKSEHSEHEIQDKKYYEPQYYENKIKNKVEHKVEHKQEYEEKKNEDHKAKSYGHNENSRVVYTKFIPVVDKQEQHKISIVAPLKVVPIAQYIHKGSEEHDHKHYEAAVSSQHISRHDVPAPPPKGFFDHSGPAKYEFAYEVKDPHTGDQKYQHEARDGHVVKGVYSLHEADGSIRTVEYAADEHAGFSAAVKQTTKHIDEKSHH